MITEIKLTRTAHGFGQITVDAINAGIYLTKKNEWKAKLVGQSVVLKGPKGVHRLEYRLEFCRGCKTTTMQRTWYDR